MPVDMPIPLLTSERQDVDPLRLNRFADSLSRFMDCSLKSKIFFKGKIACHLLLMLYRSDQCISV